MLLVPRPRSALLRREMTEGNDRFELSDPVTFLTVFVTLCLTILGRYTRTVSARTRQFTRNVCLTVLILLVSPPLCTLVMVNTSLIDPQLRSSLGPTLSSVDSRSPALLWQGGRQRTPWFSEMVPWSCPLSLVTGNAVAMLILVFSLCSAGRGLA